MRLLMTLSLLVMGMNIQAQKVYLADNGVTIKASADAKAGDTGVVNGVTYTVVDSTTLINKIAKGDDVTKVCTSLITDMSQMFIGNRSFNQDIGGWDVSNVTDMSQMFIKTSFNQDIGGWDVSNVTDMSNMFNGNRSFNQYIGGWDVSNVTDMSGMFAGASYFNQPIPLWDVSNVTDMSDMFREGAFEGDLTMWDVSNVLYCSGFAFMGMLNPFDYPKFKCRDPLDE